MVLPPPVPAENEISFKTKISNSRNEEWLLKDKGFGGGGDKKVLKLDCNDVCTTSNILKTTELCTCTLIGWIWWYMNYILAKLVRQKVLLVENKKKHNEIDYHIDFEPELIN